VTGTSGIDKELLEGEHRALRTAIERVLDMPRGT
jgi:hypothetical protein